MSESRLIINIYPSSGNPVDNVYNVDAWRRVNTADSGGQALEPGSSIVLAHPFEWDQGIMKDGILTSDSVDPGRYAIDASFGLDPEGVAIYDQKEITIAREQ